MIRTLGTGILAAVVIALAAISSVRGGEELVGTLSVIQEKDQEPSSISIKTDDGAVHPVVKEDVSLLMAELAAGERVKVAGYESTAMTFPLVDGRSIRIEGGFNVQSWVVLLEGVVRVERIGRKVKGVRVGERELDLTDAVLKLADDAADMDITAVIEYQPEPISRKKKLYGGRKNKKPVYKPALLSWEPKKVPLPPAAGVNR